MHGLINRSIQNFVCDRFGQEVWEDATRLAGLDITDFEAMLTYEDSLTARVLDAVAAVTRRPLDDIMEDIGTYLVSTPSLEGVRRLLRFGGVDFEDFLHSLDDLPDRARLAVPELDLPPIELRAHSQNRFSLVCKSPLAGFGQLLMGVLRVMADDYGALVFLEHTGGGQGMETVSITLIETDFAEGRRFELGARAG